MSTSKRSYIFSLDHGLASISLSRSPDNANTCCPQLTIRLDAMVFRPEKDKKLRHVLNRWKKFIIGEDEVRTEQPVESVAIGLSQEKSEGSGKSS